MAITTNTTNSLDNNMDKFETEAPSAFLMPISFVRCSVVNAASANKPKHAMAMANP